MCKKVKEKLRHAEDLVALAIKKDVQDKGLFGKSAFEASLHPDKLEYDNKKIKELSGEIEKVNLDVYNTNKWNENTNGFRVFFMGLNAVFCGLAFYIPCCLKYIAPNFSMGDGILTIIYVHLAGIGIASFVLIKLIHKGRKKYKSKAIP